MIRRLVATGLVLSLVLALAGSLRAQEPKPDAPKPDAPKQGTPTVNDEAKKPTGNEKAPNINNATYVIFGWVIVVFVETVVAFKSGWNQDSVKVVGLTCVIFAAVVAATSIPKEDNPAAVIGLLGAIGGYLAGKDSAKAGPPPGAAIAGS